MTKILISTFAFIVALTLFGNLFAALTDEQQNDGLTAAKNWLSLVDQGNYDQSWEDAAIQLKLTMDKSLWETLLESTRKPLGAVKTRELVQKDPASNPEGLPAGDYLVVVFQTTFASTSSQELLTLSLGTDGKWRVMTYLIKPQA